MRIIIETIPHKNQRYPTVGDWQFHDSDCLPIIIPPYEAIAEHLHIKVSETGNEFMNFLIARHELDEAIICARSGISQDVVDKYDKEHPEAGGDRLSDNLDAPYSAAHNHALSAEWIMSQILGIDWGEYSNKVDELIEEGK